MTNNENNLITNNNSPTQSYNLLGEKMGDSYTCEIDGMTFEVERGFKEGGVTLEEIIIDYFLQKLEN